MYLLGSIPSAQQFYDELQVEVGKEERKWEIQKKRDRSTESEGPIANPVTHQFPAKKAVMSIWLIDHQIDRTFSRFPVFFDSKGNSPNR